jgi:hypothetical protein
MGIIHVIDFGLARFLDDATVTRTGQLVGTPIYMSPEQVTGRIELDCRTDIYSLGVVLYELLSLSPPITASSREGIVRKIVTKRLTPVSWVNAAIPSDLENIVHKATSKDPDERYSSAGEFAEDIDRFLAGSPAQAPKYRHQFDASEIKATRPTSVTVSAVISLSFALLAGTQLASVILEWSLSLASGRSRISGEFRLLVVLLSAAVLAICCTTGIGLMSGRVWARWIAAMLWGCAACIFMFYFFAVYFITGGVIAPLIFVAVTLLPLALLLVMPWLLFRKRSSEWFKYANQIRREQSRPKRAFARR